MLLFLSFVLICVLLFLAYDSWLSSKRIDSALSAPVDRDIFVIRDTSPRYIIFEKRGPFPLTAAKMQEFEDTLPAGQEIVFVAPPFGLGLGIAIQEIVVRTAPRPEER